MLIFILISPLFCNVKSQQYQSSDEGVLYHKETQLMKGPGLEHQCLVKETNITGKKDYMEIWIFLFGQP